MFTCFIIDDEFSAETLSTFIRHVPDLKLASVFNDISGAYKDLTNSPPDILFIDISFIYTPLFIERLYVFFELSSEMSVIFTSYSLNHAFDAFERNAVDYLLKPIDYSRFTRAIIKTRKYRAFELEKQLVSIESDSFFIKQDIKGKKIVKIKYDDIIYIEGCQNYVTIHLENSQHLTYLTMKEIEECLPPEKFSRVHKSHIINDHRIVALEGNQITLNNQTVITLGSSYRSRFFDKFRPIIIQSKRSSGKNSGLLREDL